MSNINYGFQILGGTFKNNNIVNNQLKTGKEEQEKPLDEEDKKDTQPIASSCTKVFVAYNHKDTKWVEKLRVHFVPLEKKGIIELWDDSKIPIGARWREEQQVAIQSFTIAILVLSADFLAEYELPKFLSNAETNNATLIPLIVAPCQLKGSGIDELRAMNPVSKPLSGMTHSAQEETLVKLVKTVEDIHYQRLI